MARFLNAEDPDFAEDFDDFLTLQREARRDVRSDVARIVEDVIDNGDSALIALTEAFDKLRLTPDTIAYAADEIAEACARVAPEDRAALEAAKARITAYHERQKPQDAFWTDAEGAELGWRWTPVDTAGLYVPGGLASYPSSVLMNAIPARVAGVARVVVCVPAPKGEINPLVLLACHLSGVDRVYRVGGAQAIAAMAYGTETIPPVDKITGPGNAFVAEAKRQVYGHVGIDMIAGPSEVLILADADNDPDWIALDLMAQAEHDRAARAILMTDDADLGARVASAVETRLGRLERRDIARQSWEDFGAIVIVPDWTRGAGLANRIAPEHLQICLSETDAVLGKIRNAGAIFLGSFTPEALGDYISGPNHVLPTERSARFSSGLSTLDFMKRTSLSRLSPDALAAIGPYAVRLAAAEGLEAHRLSVEARLERLNRG